MQVANLFEPINAAHRGEPPLTIRTIILPREYYTAEGAIQQSSRVETYVLFSALPEELRARVATAIQALASGV